MPNAVLTLDNLKDEISTRLGGNHVSVELVAEDIKQCAKDCMRLLTAHRPGRRTAALAITVGQKRYTLTHPGLLGVMSCSFVRAGAPSIADPFDPYYAMGTGTMLGGNTVAGGETFGDLQQRLQYAEDASRIVSAEPEWTFLWDGPNAYLFIDIVNALYDCSYEYTFGFTPDDNVHTGMQLVPGEDVEWCLDFMVARAKQIVGRARGKYAGITNSEGGTDEVDWQAILDEGKESEQQLRESLMKRRRPPLPELG